ncbi:MAG: hypothetical protein WC337_11095 [Candidatus Muiribacteriota bacterium]
MEIFVTICFIAWGVAVIVGYTLCNVCKIKTVEKDKKGIFFDEKI